MGCPTCYETTSPEIVPVTINQTVVQIGNSPAMHRTNLFEFGDVADNRTFPLSYFPYEPRSVEVYLNSGAQRYAVDYEVHGQYVVMASAISSGDQVFVRYLSVSGTVASQGANVGSIVASVGTELDGFLMLDGGVINHEWAGNITLKNWFWADGDGVSAGIGNPADTATPGKTRRDSLLISGEYDSNNFKLIRLQDTSYDGTNFVTLNKFISRGSGA